MNKPSFEEVLKHPDRWLTERQSRWLASRGALAWAAEVLCYVANWILVRLLFRYSVRGRRHLPASGPFIITPNHSSPLDAQLLGAALPLAVLQHSYWTGKETVVLKNWLRRLLSWYTRIMPIPDDVVALAPATKILGRGESLIWFPEGTRSLDGELGDFKPGVAWLLTQHDVPVVPVFILGANAACPRSRTMPRFWTRVEVRIGPPQSAEQLGLRQPCEEDCQNAADSLRQSVIQLREQP